MDQSPLLVLLILLAATLYSSVGHAGASGYLAAMALFGVAPETMRPAALVLNILVASIGTFRFCRAGYFSWRTFWPLAVGAVPCAFLGGWLTLPGRAYKIVVGAILICAAVWLLVKPAGGATRRAPILAAILCGAGIGFISGLTGTGGGIFLSPLLLFMGWADTKETAAVSVAFILVNSIAGVAGLLTKSFSLHPMLPYWAVAVVAGALVGSELGTKRLPIPALRRVLAVVLVIAGLKLMLT
jgi:uncharacterized protein